MTSKNKIYLYCFLPIIIIIILFIALFFISKKLNNKPLVLKHEKTVTVPPTSIKTPKSDTINVLAIRGGGIRGLLPLHILQYLEQKTNKSTSELFDIIAGTSSGALNASILTIPESDGKSRFSASEAINFYKNDASKIFQVPLWRKIITINGFFAPMMKSLCVYNILKKIVGNMDFSSLNNRVIIPAYNLSLHRPIVFLSWKDTKPSSDHQLAELLAGATAAPGFFAPVLIQNLNHTEDQLLLDGSLFMNDPSLEAYFIAKETFPHKKIRLITLGTGSINIVPKISAKQDENMGLLKWLTNIFLIMFRANEQAITQQLSLLQDYENSNLIKHEVFDTELPVNHINIFDGSKTNVEALCNTAKLMVKKNQDRLDKLASLLVEEK